MESAFLGWAGGLVWVLFVVGNGGDFLALVSPCWASSFLYSCKETEPKKHAPTHKPFIKSMKGSLVATW